MYRTLCLVCLVLLVGLDSTVTTARDVQLRPRSESGQGASSFTAASGGATTASGAPQRPTTEERLQRLENAIDNQLLDMLSRIQVLERELQSLRGELEVHSHDIREINKKQRDLYLDLDRRLAALEQALKQQPQAQTQPSGTPVTPATPITASITAQPSASSVTPAAAKASVAEDDQQAYQAALDHLYQQKYDTAIAAFQAYIKQYPKGRYAHVSQYWVAEAYYAQGKFKDAVNQYLKLIDDYPSSPKLAEAMLKVAEGYERLNDSVRAQKACERVVKTYPGTDEAKQAQVLLQRLKQKSASGKAANR